jgi:hypothetical protein
VQKWTDFYKRYRSILDSDIIHVRRPDGRDIDCMLHVNPNLEHKGLAMIFNPLDQPVKRTIALPLYCTGIRGRAMIRREEGATMSHALDNQSVAQVSVEMSPRSVTWLVIDSAD